MGSVQVCSAAAKAIVRVQIVTLPSSRFVVPLNRERLLGSTEQQPSYNDTLHERAAEQNCQFKERQKQRFLEQGHIDEPFLE